MSETKETTDRRQGGARKPVSAQRTEHSGHVQQNFSHGRKNVVVVERKKTRTINVPGKDGASGGRGAPGRQGGGVRAGQGGAKGLSSGEVDKRTQAVLLERKRQEDEAKQRAIEAEQRRVAEELEAERRLAEDAAEAERQRVEAEARKAAEAQAKIDGVELPPAAPPPTPPRERSTARGQSARPQGGSPAGSLEVRLVANRVVRQRQRAPGREAPPAPPRSREDPTPTKTISGTPVTARGRRTQAEEEEDTRRKAGPGGAKAPRDPSRPTIAASAADLTVDKLLERGAARTVDGVAAPQARARRAPCERHAPAAREDRARSHHS